MSVYRRGDLWHFDFWHLKRRHTSPKGFDARADAEQAEANLKRVLRRRAAGLEALAPEDTPTFTDWAATTFEWQRDKKKIKRPDAAMNNLRMVLAFWGAKPTRTEPVDGGEYRNLRLGHPIAAPELIGEFEAWMTARGISGTRKNHYRSACSMIYRVALLPENRRLSGVRENPFAGVMRDRVRRRLATVSQEQLEQWLNAAPIGVCVAVALGTLTPALRFGNVARLRRTDIAPARDFLSVPHKTDRLTGLPLTVAISPQLKVILDAVFAAFPDDPYVVPLPAPAIRRRPRNPKNKGTRDAARYWQLQKLVRVSLRAASVPYGRALTHGVTFHSLRHTMSTWITRWGLGEAQVQRALAHDTPDMAAWYRHLSGVDTVAPMALIGERVDVSTTVLKRLSDRGGEEKSRARSAAPTRP